MASDIPDLEAFVRTDTGKGPAGRMRRDGMVPGIVFGGDSDPLPISIPFNVLLKRLKAGRFKSTLFNLKVDGQEDTRARRSGVAVRPSRNFGRRWSMVRRYVGAAAWWNSSTTT